MLRLGNMVTIEELQQEEEYEDILADITEEMRSHGTVERVHIPRPSKDDNSGKGGVGLVFVAFSNAEECRTAARAMTGRQFGGRAIHVSYYDEKKFYGGDWN